MRKVSRVSTLATFFIGTMLAGPSPTMAADLPSFITADCHASKYYMKPINAEWVIDQGTVFYQESVNLSRRDRQQPFGSNVPSWAGSRVIDIKDGYALDVTIDFMKNRLIGDFEQPDPAIALDAKLIYTRNNKQVLSSTTVEGSIVITDTSSVTASATINDAELETLLARTGIAIPPPLEYGGGFRYWAAIRDHFGDALNASELSDFLKPLGRASNLIVPSVSVRCNLKRPGM